jgi:putative transposase
MQVITELKNRGVQDIFIACVDGLKGFIDAIETIYPETQVQLELECIYESKTHSKCMRPKAKDAIITG